MLYERLPLKHPSHRAATSALVTLYLGALLIALAGLVCCWATASDCRAPRCSGVCWSGLVWRRPDWDCTGGTKSTGLVDGGTLAVMNNALVPAGLLVNLLIWNHDADLLRLALGGAVIAASLPLVDLGRTRRSLPRCTDATVRSGCGAIGWRVDAVCRAAWLRAMADAARWRADIRSARALVDSLVLLLVLLARQTSLLRETLRASASRAAVAGRLPAGSGADIGVQWGLFSGHRWPGTCWKCPWATSCCRWPWC